MDGDGQDQPQADPGEGPRALSRALSQSEQVHDKVERAAVELSVVNEILKDELRPATSVTEVVRALDQSEAVEAAVHEAADELALINDALAEEVDERHHLEGQLADSDVALTHSRAEARRARHDALHDPATGLPNMTLFNDRVSNALAQAQRHTRRLAVLFLDVDEFKRVNDRYGHHIGDGVLGVIAQRLETSLRAGDTVSRRSGDEFLILMLDVNDEADVATFAARITARVAEPCAIDGATLTVTLSVGAALYPEGGRSAADLMKHADAAMYAAKRRKAGSLLDRECGEPSRVRR
jgi:diguanylate cyclase (GGDEF)-like protein